MNQPERDDPLRSALFTDLYELTMSAAYFAEVHPDTTLLVDTYDTLEGVRTVVDLSRDNDRPLHLGGIRLDSGDLGELARQSRGLLDIGKSDRRYPVSFSSALERTLEDVSESLEANRGYPTTNGEHEMNSR